MVTFALQRAQGWDRTVWCPLDILTPTGLFCNKSRSIRCFFFLLLYNTRRFWCFPPDLAMLSLPPWHTLERRNQRRTPQKEGERSSWTKTEAMTLDVEHTEPFTVQGEELPALHSLDTQTLSGLGGQTAALQHKVCLLQQKQTQRSTNRVHNGSLFCPSSRFSHWNSQENLMSPKVLLNQTSRHLLRRHQQQKQSCNKDTRRWTLV